MLYVMRHGQTDWNVAYKLQGQTDIPLNDNGIQMAKDAREKYKDKEFDICFSSPLIRAVKTAELFLEGSGVKIICDDRLKEVSFGVCEGSVRVYKDPSHPIYPFFNSPNDYNPPEGAESFEELFARTKEFLEEVVRPLLEAGKNVLIVGHGAMNSSIICNVKNYSLDRFWETGIENCRLIEVSESN